MNAFDEDLDLVDRWYAKNEVRAPARWAGKSRHKAEPAKPKIAALERFEPPGPLNGFCGQYRCPHEQCKVPVQTDLEAIRWWLDHTTQTETTYACRRAAAEKLLNWAVIARGKAVSSLSEVDFAAFSAFLCDPSPAEQWIYPGNVARESDGWRPFRRALAPSARRATMFHIASLVNWMSEQRYANLRCMVGERVLKNGFATSAVPDIGERSPEREPPLSVEEWHQIRRTLDKVYPADEMTSNRFIVELLYYGNYFITDLVGLRTFDFEAPNRVVPCWSVRKRQRLPEPVPTLYAPPPLSQTIERWMNRDTSPSDGLLRLRFAKDAAVLDLTAPQIAAKVKQVLHHASRDALERGNVQLGLRLRERHVTAFRGAFHSHQRPAGSDRDALNLTADISFDPEVVMWAMGKGKKRVVWDWSHAQHLWTDRPASTKESSHGHA